VAQTKHEIQAILAELDTQPRHPAMAKKSPKKRGMFERFSRLTL
jgi:hypothetical protein